MKEKILILTFAAGLVSAIAQNTPSAPNNSQNNNNFNAPRPGNSPPGAQLVPGGYQMTNRPPQNGSPNVWPNGNTNWNSNNGMTNGVNGNPYASYTNQYATYSNSYENYTNPHANPYVNVNVNYTNPYASYTNPYATNLPDGGTNRQPW